MVNWSREGGSVFLIMFKTRHALPLPGGRFLCPRIGRDEGGEGLRNMRRSWPQTRHIRELASSAHRTRKRIVRVCERPVFAFSPCQRACPLKAYARDIAMASTVHELALHIDTKCPETVRKREHSAPANPPRNRIGHKLQLARNSSWHHRVSSTSRPASFPAQIQVIPYHEHV